MKFNDVLMATAILILVGLLLDAVLMVAFIPLSSNTTSDLLAFVISILVVSLAVGAVFALKIQEEYRVKAAGGIAALSAFVILFFMSIWISNPYASPWFKDSLNTMFNNSSSWTNYEWSAYAALQLTVETVVAFVLSFVGLYAGSFLRKPKKE